jgi:hypothetical protein
MEYLFNFYKKNMRRNKGVQFSATTNEEFEAYRVPLRMPIIRLGFQNSEHKPQTNYF